MTEQARTRTQRLSAGDELIGWKVAGAPAMLVAMGIDAPAVGFMITSGLVESGSSFSLDGFTKPVLEPEIAVHMGRDLPGNATVEEAAAAIAGIGPAIEIADVDGPVDDLQEVIGANIFHRAVVLGPVDTDRAGGSVDGVTAAIQRDGSALDQTEDPLATLGMSLPEITRHVAELLGQSGETLRAGHVIITGSVVPPIFPSAGESYGYELRPLGCLSLSFT